MFEALGQFLAITTVYATPLIWASLGGVFSERSGVVGLALEGYMIFGAFAAASSAVVLEASGWGASGAWPAFFLGGVAGMLLALLHAYASVSLRADQVVSGFVVNFLAFGLSVYLVKVFFHGAGQTDTLRQAVFGRWGIPLLERIPVLGPSVFTTYPSTYLAFLAVLVAYLLLWHTPFGLHLRAAGENAGAAATAGLPVRRIRYVGVLVSGFLAGLGGATVVLTTTGNFSHATISGQGFIALAAMIFGKWHPVGAFLASLFFGIGTGLKNLIQLTPWARDIPLDAILFFPYVLTLLVLAGFVGRAEAPRALGQAYDPEVR
ncbi:MAG: ABC transporter permease [Brockia lithotrophica]|nr:ABC transporter permease [Brockia lithotrophica]